jgi:2-succinyl-5-enolpyruvyl-6-hydroxy-3-cyclohexene-1-carboxylate synthase
MTTDPATSCLARLIVGLLVRSGIAEIVVSPGSRSTPYVQAVLESADLRSHVIVDERSAGYVALGLARAKNHPVALLCTSGTAVANYLPAVVEARLCGVPLILLTADRPLSLQDCAAPQTIDQRGLFGSHVVASTAITIPTGCVGDFVRVRRQVLSTLALAQGLEPGPVHINLHTPKPLELVTAANHPFLNDLLASATRLQRPCPPTVDHEAVRGLVAGVDRERRGIITCGFEPDRTGLDPHELARFARTSGYPVLLDASHPLRFNPPAALCPYLIAPFEPLLRIGEWQHQQAPRLVIQIGRPLTSSSFERWLETNDSSCRIEHHIVLARRGWPDPSGRAEFLANGDPSEALARASAELESSPPRSSGWAARWFRAANVVRTCISTFAKPVEGGGFGELRAILALLDALPSGSRLVIGNSLPIRELDLVASPNQTVSICSEALRGASGIDGVLSTAAGFALANDRTTTLVIGDISFLHDIGGLWACRAVSAPLAIVVINNGGGRIFEQLPVARAVSREALAHWTTPQCLDLSAAARLYGLPYLRADCASALSDAVAESHTRPGATLIEVVVPPDSPGRQTDELMLGVRASLLRAGLLGTDTPA